MGSLRNRVFACGLLTQQVSWSGRVKRRRVVEGGPGYRVYLFHPHGIGQRLRQSRLVRDRYVRYAENERDRNWRQLPEHRECHLGPNVHCAHFLGKDVGG